MFSKKGDLSPDLEWMLQSGQVDELRLITALVQTHYARIYHRALAHLTYPEDARRVAEETLTQAILSANTYRGSIPIAGWLDEIYNRIRNQQMRSIQEQQVLNPRLIHSIKKTQERDEFTPLQQEETIQAITARLQSRRTSRSSEIAFQVLGLLGVITLILVIMIGSRDFSSSVPTAEETSTVSNMREEASASLSTPLPQEDDQEIQQPAIEPLTLNSTSEEIRKRIAASPDYWDSMWVELVVTFHGPGSYSGPPYQEKHQFWIDPQQGGMLVSGPVDEFPVFIDRFTIPSQMESLGRASWSDQYTYMGSQWPWFMLNIETVLKFPFVFKYLTALPILDWPMKIVYRPIREDLWADHEVLITNVLIEDGSLLARIYIEPHTGIVLREQYYSQHPDRRTLVVSSITELEFNQPMPKMWKSVNSGMLSPRLSTPEDDHTPDIWGQTNLPRETSSIPPENFDPGTARIIIYKKTQQNVPEVELELYDIYADNFLLGEVPLIDPLSMICTRSPDGNILAFTKWELFPSGEEIKINWFDLRELVLSSVTLPDLALQRLAFTQDNRLLAISGYGEQNPGGVMIVLDLESKSVLDLPIPASYSPFTWSPDGSQLVLLGNETTAYDLSAKRTVRIYSASDGDLLKEFEVQGLSMDAEILHIPIEDWVAEFNLSIQDIDTCTQPKPDPLSQ